MTAITINGHPYSDDGSTAGDMLNGGHRTHFLPLVGDVVVVAGQVAANAASAAADAASANAVATAMRGTSTTSLAVGTGSKSLTTQTGKQFAAGNYVTVSRTSAPATLMHGVVTSYTSGTGALVVDVGVAAGSGTYTDWTVAISGPQGATGPSGNGSIGYLAKSAAYTVTAGDAAKLIDCTAGTFTLSFQAAATLGSTWAAWVRNSGPGLVTLDPNGTELIDGAATLALAPGVDLLVVCDGSALRTMGRSVRAGHVHVREVQASGTDAGASADLTTQWRVLNTVVDNSIAGASLASNKLTLPPGTYKVRASAPGYGCNTHRLTLYNVTAGAAALVGPNGGATIPGDALAVVSGVITLTVSTELRLDHYTQSARVASGLGRAVNNGGSEIYSELEAWRV